MVAINIHELLEKDTDILTEDDVEQTEKIIQDLIQNNN